MIFKRKHRISKTIKFTPTIGNSLYDITSLIELTIDNYGLKNRLVNIHVQASTAAILIQENGDSRVKRDLIHFLQNLIQSNLIDKFNQDNYNEANVKAALIGPSKTIPVIKGKLALSKCQKIFFCEFDEPNIEREILITPFRN